MSWNDSGVTPGGVKLTSSTWAHYTSSWVIFIPDKFSLKWETESLKNRNKGVSESQPLTNTPARILYNMYGAHTCKYLANWRNYTKRDLNLKCQIGVLLIFQNWHFACTIRKGQPCLVWLVSRNFLRGNDRVISLQETNKKLPEIISSVKRAANADSARSQD